jgi:hypothetical protein
VVGACRDGQVRTPPAFSPQNCCETTAARTGGGVLFSHSWGGVTGRGAAQAAGSPLSYSETKEPSLSQIIQDSALNEYRTALISAAVTGKIDVRNA